MPYANQKKFQKNIRHSKNLRNSATTTSLIFRKHLFQDFKLDCVVMAIFALPFASFMQCLYYYYFASYKQQLNVIIIFLCIAF